MEQVPARIKEAAALGVVFVVLIYIIHAETSDLRQGISDLNHDVAAIKERVDKDEQRVKETNQRIDDLLGKVFDKVVPSLTKKPTKAELEKANAIVRIAQASGVKLSTTIRVKKIHLANDVSHPYATLIKRGVKIPHPGTGNHWLVLSGCPVSRWY